MKTLLKILIAGAVVVVLAVAVVVFLVVRNLDGIVRSGTEQALEYVLQVPVSVGGASVEVSSGAIEFTDIVISNPQGFKSEHAMAFGKVRAEADIASFRTNNPVIHLIHISGSHIILEKSASSSNLQVLLANAQRLAAGGEDAPPPEDEASEKKMVIEKLLIDATTVGVQVPVLDKTFNVDLPDVEKENIGGGEGEQVTPAEAMQEILAILLEQIREAGTGILPGDLLNDLGDTLRTLPADLRGRVGDTTERLRGTVDSALEGVTSGGKESTDRAGEIADDAADTIKGIFGKKDKD